MTIWKIVLFFALFITLSSSNIGSIGTLETLFDNFKTSFYGTVNGETNSYFHYEINGELFRYVSTLEQFVHGNFLQKNFLLFFRLGPFTQRLFEFP